MKIIIEGSDKKINQLHRELKERCKRDKLSLIVESVESIESITELDIYSEIIEKTENKRGRKPNK